MLLLLLLYWVITIVAITSVGSVLAIFLMPKETQKVLEVISGSSIDYYSWLLVPWLYNVPSLACRMLKHDSLNNFKLWPLVGSILDQTEILRTNTFSD